MKASGGFKFGLLSAVLAGLVLGALGYWWATDPVSSITKINFKDETESVAAAVNTSQNNKSAESVSGSASVLPPESEMAPDEQKTLNQFRQWQAEEAKVLDRANVDEVAHFQAIQNRIKTFTKIEWDEIVNSVLDIDRPANQRVLSAYMLGVGGFDNLQAVERVLDEKLPEGPNRPHSEEESRSLREKSLKMMIIDELIEQVKTDPSKQGQLLAAIRRIDDPYLRNLANRRVAEAGLQSEAFR